MKRLLALLFVLAAAPCYAGTRDLKEDTAVVIVVGPFIDDTGAAVTAPTIASIDCNLYKNDGTKVDVTLAASGSSNDMVHVDDGYFSLELTTTDTSTPGYLRISMQISGALIFHEDFNILPANIYDSKYSTDFLQVDAVQISGDTAGDSFAAVPTNVWTAATRTLTALDEDSTTLDLNATAIGSVATAVTLPTIPTDWITATGIATDAIGAAEVAADAIGASELAANSITSSEVADDSIDAGAIATSAIGAAELAADSITSSEIADGAIDAGALASDTITAAKIAADAIGASEIATDAIGDAEVASDVVVGLTTAERQKLTGFASVVYVAHTGDAQDSGDAAKTAIEAATAGTLVLLGPGIFEFGSVTPVDVTIPAGVTVRGAGRKTTILETTVGDGNYEAIIPGTRSAIESLTIRVTQDAFPICIHGSTQVLDAIVRDVDLISANLECVDIVTAGASSIRFEDVYASSVSEWGMTANGAAHAITLQNVHFHVSGNASTTDFKGFGIEDGTALYGDHVKVTTTEAASGGQVLRVVDGSKAYLSNCSFFAGEMHVEDTDGELVLINCDFDRSKRTGETGQIVDIKTDAVTANLASAIELDGSVYRLTTNALEQAPTGGTNPNVLVDTTLASVTNQTTVVLTAGSTVDDTYNGQAIVLTDASNSDYPSVRVVSDYVGSTKTVTLNSATDFTMVSGDGAKIFVTAPGTTAPTSADNATAVWAAATRTITGTGTDAITATSIAADAIGASELAADAIGASELATDAIGAAEIATNAIGSAEVADGAIDAGAFASDAITAAKVASDVTTELQSGLATSAALATVDGIIDNMYTAFELDSTVYRLTTNALEQGAAGSGLDAAGVRAAVGLASANLDTQLGDLPTAAENATALLGVTTSDTGSGTLGRALHYLRTSWVSSGVFSTGALANAPAGGEGGGTTQPRINRVPDPAFTFKVSRRADGTYACPGTLLVVPGAVEIIHVAIDMSPLFGTTNFVETVGTPSISGGDLTVEAEGPRDWFAFIEVDGTATASEEREITVPVTMTSGAVVQVKLDVSVPAE
jgi:hypothetical protein